MEDNRPYTWSVKIHGPGPTDRLFYFVFVLKFKEKKKRVEKRSGKDDIT